MMLLKTNNLHDRLGSVRQLIDTSGNVKNRYTYDPFGELFPAPDFEETVDNPFKFTGQYFDAEIEEYYLRARQYDPHIARFTARDPVFGEFKEPLTLHVYLCCLNDPVNRTDPTGELSGISTWAKINAKIAAVGVSARAGVERFVQTLNLRSVWMEFTADMSDVAGVGKIGLVKFSNMLASVASHGWKAIAAIAGALGSWEAAEPGGPVEFAMAVGGDPHPPQTVSGAAGVAVHEFLKELWEDLVYVWEDLSDRQGVD